MIVPLSHWKKGSYSLSLVVTRNEERRREPLQLPVAETDTDTEADRQPIDDDDDDDENNQNNYYESVFGCFFSISVVST